MDRILMKETLAFLGKMVIKAGKDQISLTLNIIPVKKPHSNRFFLKSERRRFELDSIVISLH
jgi:hypothetical protein